MSSTSFRLRSTTIIYDPADIDIDRISPTTYLKYLNMLLKVPPPERTSDDIEKLKKCTSYIQFFQKNEEIDPFDKLRSHENGCKYLRYTFREKGGIVLRHRD